MIRRVALGLVVLAACAAPLRAEVHEKQVPLNPGVVGNTLRWVATASWFDAMNKSMGDGCRVTVDHDQLTLHVDPDKFPHTGRETKATVRRFVAAAAPDATADYNHRLGLFLPKHLDPARPLVVMIHGLDTDQAGFYRMNQLLTQAGYQTAYFVYPNDQPLADSAAMLHRHFVALHESFPKMNVDLVCHSMGSLVARSYIEGPGYAGGVDHFILLGPPNQGSKWTGWRWALEVRDHVRLWQSDSKWHPTWMIADGLGEAGSDLKVGSDFLAHLNACDRRDGVKYTIIAGNQHTMRRMTADTIDGTLNHLPDWKVTKKMQTWSEHFRNDTDTADGPVEIASTRLKGVNDVVVLKADHDSLYLPIGAENPASWETIRDRLAR